MKIIAKIITIAVLAVVLCIGLLYTLQMPLQVLTNESRGQPVKMIDAVIPSDRISLYQMGSNNFVTIHASEPETPVSLPVYRAVLQEGDYIDTSFDTVFKDRTEVISEQDAPEAAKKALEPYGGIPPDAVFGGAKTVYGYNLNRTTWKEESGTPIYTDVFFNRNVDGMTVIGFSDKIQVTLGEPGKVLGILKIWRTLEKTNKIMAVIPARFATDKLQNGDVLDKPNNVSNVSITAIKLYYYETSRTDKEIYLEPVWAFQGNTSSDSPEEFLVYARQFAGFTQTPAMISKTVAGKTTAIKDPFTVTFTDTSDANPTKWQWDFGDGTTSTEKNPTHRYKNAGTYNVTLTVWNELGSDTMVRQYTVTPESTT